jgi:hypothetical protein
LAHLESPTPLLITTTRRTNQRATWLSGSNLLQQGGGDCWLHHGGIDIVRRKHANPPVEAAPLPEGDVGSDHTGHHDGTADR